MSINQKEGVYSVVKGVLSEMGVVDEGKARDQLGPDGVKQVGTVVCAMLINGEIDMTTESRAKYETPEAMARYTSGLVNNWLNKDVRLNGGDKYVAKNPGSREGGSDETIKALKGLKIMHAGNDEVIAQIDQAIEARKAELKVSKVKVIEIDVSKLPEGLQHLAG